MASKKGGRSKFLKSLFSAATKKEYDNVAKLIKGRADINQAMAGDPNYLNKTVLHYASGKLKNISQIIKS